MASFSLVRARKAGPDHPRLSGRRGSTAPHPLPDPPPGCISFSYMPSRPVPPTIPPVRAIFRAIAVTVVPEAVRLDVAGWSEVEEIVERALAERPAAMRRQLSAFLRAVELLPVARHGRRFTGLDAERRTRVLTALQRSRVLALRRGMWGIRTLIFMGYYARPAAAAEIGYRANAGGWEARLLADSPVPEPGRPT